MFYGAFHAAPSTAGAGRIEAGLCPRKEARSSTGIETDASIRQRLQLDAIRTDAPISNYAAFVYAARFMTSGLCNGHDYSSAWLFTHAIGLQLP